MCERISGLICISVGAVEKVGEVRWRRTSRRRGGEGGGVGIEREGVLGGGGGGVVFPVSQFTVF